VKANLTKTAADAVGNGVEEVQPAPSGAWLRTLRVPYQLVRDEEWRPARDGERCAHGAGPSGRGCGQVAVVTREKPQYRRSFCAAHSGGRLPLEDGRVIEPVSNPLGGA
jgi:hypothetical protein